MALNEMDAFFNDYDMWRSERYAQTARVDLIQSYHNSPIAPIGSEDLANKFGGTRDIIADCVYEKADADTKAAMISTCKAWSNWLLPKNESTPKIFSEYMTHIHYQQIDSTEGTTYVTLRDDIEIYREFIQHFWYDGNVEI